MAQTTTAVNACDAKIMLDAANGTPADISGSSNSAAINFENEIGEVKVFGSGWKSRLSCGQDATLKLTAVYTTAVAEALALLRGWQTSTHTVPRTISISVPDDEIGSDVYSGEWLISTLDIPLEADDADPILVDGEFLPNGPVTWAVIAE